jgi:hypothetical protein
MTIAELLGRLEGVQRTQNGWQARCPAHDDRRASLSIMEGWKGIVLHCHAGCSPEAVAAKMGLSLADLFNGKPSSNTASLRIVATYDYTDERGNLLFQVCRLDPKDFRQRRPDPTSKHGWTWSTKEVRRVLFRLISVIAAVRDARPVYVCEGEKDVLAMQQAGFVATCNPGGAGKWRKEYGEPLRGAEVVIIAHKDAPGRKHAADVASKLKAFAKSIRIIELPGLDGKPVKDAADYFEAGGEPADLDDLARSAPEWNTESFTRDGSASSDGDTGDEPEHSDNEKGEKPKKSFATRLVELAKDFAFFHNPENRPFVRLGVNGHTEIWSVNSPQFRNLLSKIFWKKIGKAINRNALGDAVATLAGIACHDGPEEPVFLRVAPYGEKILIDVCDQEWRVVEVTAHGWTVLDKSPVAFIRTGAMRPLPVPASAERGCLDLLWDLLNVTPDQRPLVSGALLNYFHPCGPYFVIDFLGEQGTAKSCAAKIVRMLVDPNEIPLRSPPREERDLLIQAANNWVVAIDNLSSLQPWQSDGLCRLSTGGGHSARQLYTDGEEFSLSVKRPVILNGIDDVATRPDLAERALQIELETIPDDRRIPEKELWRKFEKAHPVIFSGLLNGLVCALHDLPTLKLDSLPRMADPTLWATAGETAFGWPRGTFLSVYLSNLRDGATASVESHPVGVAIQKLFEGVNEWVGEPAELLDVLAKSATDELKRARNWPPNARSLSACLRRLAQALRRSGIHIEFTRSQKRSIRLCKAGNLASFASPASPDETNDANDAKM